MADKSIADLPVLQAVDDTTQIPVWQPGATNPAQKLAGSKFREFAGQAAEQYVEDATQVVQRAEQALDSLGDSAARAKQSADNAAESERKAKLYADQTEASVSGVASFNGRGGHVVPQTGDYTAAMVAAAPAGYGLGSVDCRDIDGNDANNAVESGNYWVSTTTANIPTSAWNGVMRVTSRSSKAKVQTIFYFADARTFTVERNFNNNVFGAWRWVNPPMQSGEEYLTTEYIGYKDVYKRNNNGIIEYRLDGETIWKPYADAVGAVARDGSKAAFSDAAYPATVGEVGTLGTGMRLTNRNPGGTYSSLVVSDPSSSLDEALRLLYQDRALYNILHAGNVGDYAAPAGFGLGGVGDTAIDDCNNATKNGWYYLHSATKNAPAKIPFSQYGGLFACARGDAVHQFTYYNGLFATRRGSGGSFGDWEYVNPPMELGVEYRTAERYLGKPVYVYAMDFGSLPVSAMAFKEHNRGSAIRVIAYGGVASNGNSLTYIYATDSAWNITLGVDQIAFYIETSTDRSNITATVWMKYYKTTD